MDVRQVAIKTGLAVRLMGVVKSPHLVRRIVSGPFELKGVFTLSKTEEMLVVHEEAQPNTSVNSTPDRTSLAFWDCAVNVTASDVSNLLFQISDAIGTRTVQMG